jgi:small subunit ribosomal protein S21
VFEITQRSYHKYYHPGERSGICVVKRKDESPDDFVKRFRKKFSKSGIAKEFRERMYFEKPSDKKRRKKVQSIRAIKRDEEKAIRLKEKMIKARKKRARKGAKNDRSKK